MKDRVAAAARWLQRGSLGIALALACSLIAATPPGAAAEAAPPPARVGQLSLINGSGQLQLAPGQGWEPAQLNLPVAAGSALMADKLSRLEVRIGSSAVRLAPTTRCEMAELDDGNVRIELAHGRLSVRVRALPAGERFSISAGGARLNLLAPGAYRVNYLARPALLTVHVLEGQARLVFAAATGAQDLALQARQLVAADARSGRVIESGLSDERVPLDEFALNRDRHAEHSAALRHVNAEMTGAESLDGQGSWRNEPGYGAVWYPDRLPPEWAPYRYGRWRWLAPWGWTWVDDAPWGFAPFHYGRWLFQGGRWGWVPGSSRAAALNARPVYAPALVGFYGNPGTAAWSPGAGAPPVVGWYPLAPGEVYWPAYTEQPDYLRALNAASVAEPGAFRLLPETGSAGSTGSAASAGPAHRFARTAFAATALPLPAFQAMLPVAVNQLPLPPAALATAPLSARRSPPVLAARPARQP